MKDASRSLSLRPSSRTGSRPTRGKMLLGTSRHRVPAQAALPWLRVPQLRAVDRRTMSLRHRRVPQLCDGSGLAPRLHLPAYGLRGSGHHPPELRRSCDFGGWLRPCHRTPCESAASLASCGPKMHSDHAWLVHVAAMQRQDSIGTCNLWLLTSLAGLALKRESEFALVDRMDG